MLVYSFPTLPRTSLLYRFLAVPVGVLQLLLVCVLVCDCCPHLDGHWAEEGLGMGFGSSVTLYKSLCPHVALP